MAEHTVATIANEPRIAEYVAVARRIILLDSGIVLDSGVTFPGSTIVMSAPTDVTLSWFLPEGSTAIRIGVDYPSSLDAGGQRPFGKIQGSDALGIDEETVEATAGGSGTIEFTFDATPEDGTAVILLSVPMGSQVTSVDTVTFTPRPGSKQTVAAAPGKPGDNQNGGGPIRGSTITSISSVMVSN